MTDPNYARRKLPNGLTIHLKEIHTAPIISSWMWYRVGSRNEMKGITGVSHWVEHMQFKGTEKIVPGILDKIISREGGAWNAMTDIDWTTYYETMPADKINIAFELEFDRMLNSKFDPKEVASERTVIISEREGNENEPFFKLGEAVQRTAFQQHSYQHQVIGDMADIRSMSRDDLYNHYKKHYFPDNAVMAVAGDFDTAEMFDRLTGYFADLPSRPVNEIHIPVEPEQKTENRVEVHGPGETTFVQIAYHAPKGNHADLFPFLVMDSLLTGPSSLNMFGGGGISNKTSRLYQALVEKEFAVGVHGGVQLSVDPYLYEVMLTVHPERTVKDVLTHFDDEIKKLLDTQVTEAEIKRAMKQAKALFAYGSENITNQAFWMGYAEMFADYSWFLNYIDRLSEVKPEDVLRIAQKYLCENNRTIGIYIPNAQKEDAS